MLKRFALASFLGSCGLLALGCNRVPEEPPIIKTSPIPTPGGGDGKGSSGTGGTGIATTHNGLEGDDRTKFHHLAEGSEVYPLAFLLVLENSRTNKLFLDDIERFGLLADPDRGEDNPYGMPVGVTVDLTRDLSFANVQMIGINCAACHVGEIRSGGEVVARIDGAPNLFDIQKFYTELADSTRVTVSDVGKAWSFFSRLYRLYHPSETRDTHSPAGGESNSRALAELAKRSTPQERFLFAPPKTATASGAAEMVVRHPDLESLRAAGPLEKKFADQVETAFAAEVAKPPLDLAKNLVVKSDDPNFASYTRALTKKGPAPAATPESAPGLTESSRLLRVQFLGPVPRPDLKSMAALPTAANSPLERASTADRNESLGDTLQNFSTILALLKARAEFLLHLAANASGTPGGCGRVDAFGGARNIVFPDDAKPTTAPICFPHLWGDKNISWYHWDGNTDSLLERNVGQALGVGAILYKADFSSTLNVPNIVVLEDLSYKITPPAWPAAKLGEIDKKKAEAGLKIFTRLCSECHGPPPEGKKTVDRLYALDKIGTDPNRALNFAQPVQGELFSKAISAVLQSTIAKAPGAVIPKKWGIWRTTKSYAGRPLVAIWATGPFLHNGSVPTLADLLLPEGQRPKSFLVGSREYDPKKLGYKSITKQGGQVTTFDTSVTGNSNKGHSGTPFGTDLSDTDREAVLEFLKSQ